MTILEAESLFRTTYSIFKHHSGKPHIACNSYSVPTSIAHHIDFITPTIHFDVQVRVPRKNRHLKRNINLANYGPVQPKTGGQTYPLVSSSGQNLTTCSSQITLDCLKALYKFQVGRFEPISWGECQSFY